MVDVGEVTRLLSCLPIHNCVDWWVDRLRLVRGRTMLLPSTGRAGGR